LSIVSNYKDSLDQDIGELKVKNLSCGLCICNLHNFYLKQNMGVVPASNLGENSGMLCIRLGNLQLANFHKSYANLKKIGYPSLLPGKSQDANSKIGVYRWLILTCSVDSF
jgi:hypothetical protein